MYNNLLRASTYSSAAACVHCSTKSHANHSFQPCIFDCSCTVIMYHNLPRCSTHSSAHCTCALLNEQSHANHSFQPYIFDQLYSYHVTICCRARTTAVTAAACAHCPASRATPTIHSSCASLIVAAVQLSCNNLLRAV
jgi:hypothetical protein